MSTFSSSKLEREAICRIKTTFIDKLFDRIFRLRIERAQLSLNINNEYKNTAAKLDAEIQNSLASIQKEKDEITFLESISN